MNTRVIAVTRQVGSSGEEVAQAIAQGLGFRYVDYQVVQDAAREAGVSPETVSEAERTPSLLTRILEALAKNPGLPAAGWADPVSLSISPLMTSSDYRKFVEDVVRALASEGNCLILGHAAQVILKDRPDTLKVLVTGSRRMRVRRVMVGMAVDEKTAQKTVERTDAERVDYFRRFYDTGYLTPCTYDIVVNTDHLSPGQAAQIVTLAASLR